MPTPDEIRSALADLLGQIAGTSADAVRDTATLKDLGIDSVATAELAEGVATTFDIRLDNDTVNEWRTVGDVVRSVRRAESFLDSLPPPQLHADPERSGAFKQLAIVFALIGAGLGMVIGVAAAALLASGLDGGSLPPISAPVEPTPVTSSTATADPFGNGGTPTPSATPSDADLTLSPALVSVGQHFRLSGRLPTARDGETLIVEWREDGGTWAAFPITVTARTDGSFESRVYISSPGERQFRVRSNSGDATPPAVVRIS